MPTLVEIFETMSYGPAPENAEPARAWLEAHKNSFCLFIGGEWHPPTGGHYFDSINPATGETLARIAQAGPEDVDVAVQAAQQAQPAWWKLGGHGRARYLYAMARQVQKHARLFAVLETLDSGKPIRESRDIDIPLTIRHFYHHAGWAQLMETEFANHVPIGVVAQIIPWNFPLLMLAWKIAPALAMGNTVVLKPAEYTSLTALLFAEICQRIALPAGVVNIVTGDGTVGERIVQHPNIDKIAFTGSAEVGRKIRQATAGSGKRVSLELGGKSPFIVLEEADLDSAVEGVVDSIWLNQGQVCCAGSRLLVQESVADVFIRKLRARMEALRIGNPLDKAIDIGAIIAPAQLEKIRRLVQQGEREGASLWQPSWACPQEGYFFPPTLFTHVSPASTIAQEEIFGPVLVTMTFRTPTEAIELANNTRYGLAASIWTENIRLGLDMATQIHAGTIWLNSTNLFDAASGFGGCRESGFGREGGREGVREYMIPKWHRKKASISMAGNTSDNKAKEAAPESGTKRAVSSVEPIIDRTAKLYIGGKQVRPDSGYSLLIGNPRGQIIGEVGEGNRKDIRNAVEAARAASGWCKMSGHDRAQRLYFLAENFAIRAEEFTKRIQQLTGCNTSRAAKEVALSVRRLYTWAAWADKYDGAVHQTALRGITLAIQEPVGVLGILCPDVFPLLAFISTTMPALAMGNTVVAVPSEIAPLAATDFYQVLETSDMPAGVLSIITGRRDTLAEVLAAHQEVDAVWYFGSAEGSAKVEWLSASNLKRTWVDHGLPRDWMDPQQGEGPEFLQESTRVKNVWIPLPVTGVF
jgi:aldehyde dehydrogenase (NAD+)